MPQATYRNSPNPHYSPHTRCHFHLLQKALDLKLGANTITFSLTTRVAVSDIDETVDKFVYFAGLIVWVTFSPRLGEARHTSSAKLYIHIVQSGYKITSRAIGQGDSTCDYLKDIKLMVSLHRKDITRKPEVFKMARWRDIQRLFGEMSRTPFCAAFRNVNISPYTAKMELLEMTEHKSSSRELMIRCDDVQAIVLAQYVHTHGSSVTGLHPLLSHVLTVLSSRTSEDRPQQVNAKETRSSSTFLQQYAPGRGSAAPWSASPIRQVETIVLRNFFAWIGPEQSRVHSDTLRVKDDALLVFPEFGNGDTLQAAEFSKGGACH
ncbi:hypothetical protein SCLCIDRAFT_11036 [Scleroderma citrinum Foug A]|uniref:LNS2/PITP domain-containing protein n=1 Tax=Scleroderma citrinum Foug A TaxID=1036808 RepID=A0A0C3D390_9AGAM|nr:hypothetical protein SCLCIDRAFT_11036 [Scleroderma citrinum Foug A]